MKELKIENLHKTYGTKVLLDGVDFSIHTGDRIGLIGPNGTGKSSFIRVIADLDNYDEGTITKPNKYTIAYLSQQTDLDPKKTILETIYDSPASIVQLVLKYEIIREKLEKNPEDVKTQETFTKLSDQMTQEGGWDLEVKAKSILSQLGLKDLSRKVGVCSGGERKRVGLAQVLIAEPDLLILDEPTNHLDIQSIQWLEHYLSNYKGALLLVTHDRYFLERVVTKIVELRFGELEEYVGNYQTYLEQRAQRLKEQSKLHAKQDKLYQQELAWMRTGARARTTKQEARIERFEQLKESINERHYDSDGIEFNFDQQRIGNQVLEFENVSIEVANNKVVEDFTKTFVAGERVGIIGPNGIGKTTFLNTIAGIHPISTGVYKVGQTVRMAYYKQLEEDLPNDERVLSYLTQIADNFKQDDGSIASAAQMLERFNFPREVHGQEIGTLSGGERRRLYLLTLLVQQPNVLLLDEPTNDLDIDTLTVLEDYLEQFIGVVFIVSHDRYFLDKTVDELLSIEGKGEFSFIWGNYSDYLEKEKKNQSQTPVKKEDKRVRKVKETRKRMSYHEKKEWATIEDDIFSKEARIDEIQNEMNMSGNDASKLMDLQSELEDNEKALMHLYERYDYLSELA